MKCFLYIDTWLSYNLAGHAPRDHPGLYQELRSERFYSKDDALRVVGAKSEALMGEITLSRSPILHCMLAHECGFRFRCRQLNRARVSEPERLAPQTVFELCLTGSRSQNKSLSFCLTQARTRAMNMITNLRPSETLEKGRSLFVRTCNAYGLCAGVAGPGVNR
jgi:hypothetical protein